MFVMETKAEKKGKSGVCILAKWLIILVVVVVVVVVVVFIIIPYRPQWGIGPQVVY